MLGIALLKLLQKPWVQDCEDSLLEILKARGIACSFVRQPFTRIAVQLFALTKPNLIP